MAASDIVTLTEYMSYAGREQDNKQTNQTRLAMLITQATNVFEGLAGGRKFIQTVDVMTFTGRRHCKQYVRYLPIASSPTLVLEYWDGTSWQVASVGTYPRQVDLAKGEIWLTSSVFGMANWRATYTGGYLQAAIPDDVKVAVCQLVQRAEQRASGKEGITSEGMNDQSTSYDLKILATDPIKQVAARYKVFVL